MSEQIDKNVEQWFDSERQEALYQMSKRQPQNFIEISRIPNKMDIESLISLIVRATRIVPKSANICTSKEHSDQERVVLVEFKSEPQAFMVVDKLRSTSYGKTWNIKLAEQRRSDPVNIP